MRTRYPSRSRIRRSRLQKPIGEPRYSKDEVIGDFTILEYQGHSDINKRNNHIMAKPQHWYRCICSCGNQESRSQQELRDTRRNQCCYECRSKSEKEDT